MRPRTRAYRVLTAVTRPCPPPSAAHMAILRRHALQFLVWMSPPTSPAADDGRPDARWLRGCDARRPWTGYSVTTDVRPPLSEPPFEQMQPKERRARLLATLVRPFLSGIALVVLYYVMPL